MSVSLISPEELQSRFEVTKERKKEGKYFIAQKRVEKAIQTILNIRDSEYNAYISGNFTKQDIETIKELIRKTLADFNIENKLYDWCYVNNFKNPRTPTVVNLPQGKGEELKKDMEELVEYLRKTVPSVFESKEYEERIQEIVREYDEKQKELFRNIEESAHKLNFIVKPSQAGIIINPVVNGKAINEREFSLLSAEVKRDIEEKKRMLEDKINDFLRESRKLEKEKHRKVEKVNEEMGIFIVSHKIEDLKRKYKGVEKLQKYFDDVEDYTLKNISAFLPQKPPDSFFAAFSPKPRYTEYKVNVLVDNSQTKEVPVIYEEDPTYYNLFGKIEKQAYFGAFITDFTRIRPGTIHYANGGYLILDAYSVLMNPNVWETLKKTISSKKCVIEEWTERYGILASETIKPEPAPLETKIILLGPVFLYELLYVFDKDFKQLFKVKTDFNPIIEVTPHNLTQYITRIDHLCEKNTLPKLSDDALKEILTFSSRISEHKDRLYAYTDKIIDTIKEASFYAKREKVETIYGQHIKKAIEESIFRKNLIRDKILEMIKEGTLIINIDGIKIGQINGLSVISMGDFSFGIPARISARTFVGKTGIINIEKESEMAGKIFNKSVLILSGYLGWKYAYDKPLSISITLAFEQSYTMVEGDSASVAELLSILSAIGEIPLKQSLAATGSISQDGTVQPIGGVNEKVEGFFEVCKLKDMLDGEHGVVIPRRNINNLILNDEVKKAVEERKFNIYCIDTIDDAIEIFTGMKAGKKLKRGYEKGTFHWIVDNRLRKISKLAEKKEAE
ncbi:MAG: AAA family ATPase [Deltaproteobacteria bacterium]|nr:AAA family ATPase [Deltaproteobacteria bacterium]